MCRTPTLIYIKKKVIKVSQSLIYKSFEGRGESSSIHKRNREKFYTREKSQPSHKLFKVKTWGEEVLRKKKRKKKLMVRRFNTESGHFRIFNPCLVFPIQFHGLIWNVAAPLNKKKTIILTQRIIPKKGSFCNYLNAANYILMREGCCKGIWYKSPFDGLQKKKGKNNKKKGIGSPRVEKQRKQRTDDFFF